MKNEHWILICGCCILAGFVLPHLLPSATDYSDEPRVLAPPPALVPALSELYTVTAYCPCEICCGVWSDGITASGQPVTANGGKFVAAPPEISFGTMVHVPGYGYGTVPVLDRGGSIKGKRLDVFFDTHQEALEWGVQKLDVTTHKKGIGLSQG